MNLLTQIGAGRRGARHRGLGRNDWRRGRPALNAKNVRNAEATAATEAMDLLGRVGIGSARVGALVLTGKRVELAGEGFEGEDGGVLHLGRCFGTLVAATQRCEIHFKSLESN